MNNTSTVFDNGDFTKRARTERLSSPKPPKQLGAIAYINRIWNDGFRAGHEAATNRYISVNNNKN